MFAGLSRSATREATLIQSFLYLKSSPALLAMNQLNTMNNKMLNYFIIFVRKL